MLPRYPEVQRTTGEGGGEAVKRDSETLNTQKGGTKKSMTKWQKDMEKKHVGDGARFFHWFRAMMNRNKK